MGWGSRIRQCLSDRTGYYECRRCGSSLESAANECPLCESESVATYELE